MKTSRDLIIQTDDLAAATRFYSTVLRLPVTYQSDDLVGFETGAFCLYVEAGSSLGPVLEFQVPNLQEARQELMTAGCRVEQEEPAIPRCYLRDPFGLIFNLAETPTETDETSPA